MLNQLLANKIIIVAASSWLIAQVLKTLTHAYVYKKIDFKRLLGDGGMPSCHSAVVSSCACAIGFYEGFDSSLFALGVRYETGKQSKVIKDMSQFIESLNNIKFDDESLKEFVGHTRLQVVLGALLGIVVAIIMIDIIHI